VEADKEDDAPSRTIGQLECLNNALGLPRFTNRLSRERLIDTEIIENLYQIDRGVAQTLVDS
jgi:hypothetical protein